LIARFAHPAAVSLRSPLLIAVALALALGFWGCATVAPPPAPPVEIPQRQSAELIEALRQRSEQFRSLRALARVSYAGPEGKHGFEEAVLVQRPDRLRLETLTMLGAVLIVTANEREIIGYHPREGVMVRGPSSRANLLRYTKIPLELEEITALLTGLPPVDASNSWRQEGHALLFASNGRLRDAVAFEAPQPVPTRWQRFNGNGAVELSALFSDYIQTAAGWFPSRINVEAPLQSKKLEIRFQEPELNATIAAESFSQQKPPHVQEIPIELIGS